MAVAGIIAEYNPLHSGHLRQLARTRELLGADTAVVCVMSGNFVQRGDFAVVRKHVRAEAAVRSGADLVLELPLLWAVAPAERFADGAVQMLTAAGVVTHLAFGSESGEAEPMRTAARALESPAFAPLLREELAAGDSFAVARQRAAARLLPGGEAALLSAPNDILGVEYCRSLLRRNSALEPLVILRDGAGHDSPVPEPASRAPGGASASAIRQLLTRGDREAALGLMAPAMAALCRQEEAAGRAPVSAAVCERAILARLRCLTEEECVGLDGGREGLGRRFRAAAREAASLSELLAAAKTKRYAAARLRRMALWAYLGIRPAGLEERVPYLRVLAANRTGCGLLARMRKASSLPVLTKPADVRRLSAASRELFAREAQATDLYALAYPELAASSGGAEWRLGPVIL